MKENGTSYLRGQCSSEMCEFRTSISFYVSRFRSRPHREKRQATASNYNSRHNFVITAIQFHQCALDSHFISVFKWLLVLIASAPTRLFAFQTTCAIQLYADNIKHRTPGVHNYRGRNSTRKSVCFPSISALHACACNAI